MIKILHTITGLEKGGAENHLAILASIQKRNNYKVSIFFSKKSNYWISYLKKKKIKIKKPFLYNDKNLFYLFFKLFLDLVCLIKIINNEKPQIVHAHLPYMEIISCVAIFFSFHKPKLIITRHLDSVFFKGSDGQKKSFLGSLIFKFISNRTSKIIAISKSVKKFLSSDFMEIDKKKIKIVYYGIDKVIKNSRKNKKINFEKKFNTKKNELIIGCIGRLVPQKSIKTLIESAVLLKSKIKFKIIIVGDGYQKKFLKDLTIKNCVADKIVWIDFLDEVEDFLKFIDIFALPSLYEGLGLVFLEAMLCKKPIVASNVSAAKELIKNNYNGFLIKPKNYVQLYEKILALNNKKKRIKLGNNGYKFVKKNFKIKMMFLETKKIYENVLKY